MPLDKQLIPIRLGGGVDTRSDAKTIGPGKLATLSNGVFTTPSSVRKRYGGSQIASQVWNKASGIGSAGAAGSLSGARLLGVLDDDLLLATKDGLYSYSNGYWQLRGPLSQFQVRTKNFRIQDSANNTVCASTSDLVVYAWESYESGIGYDIRWAAFDATTGASIVTGQLAFDAGGNVHTRPALVAVGSTICLFGAQVSASKIKMVAITRDGGSVTKSATADVITDLHATVPVFDIRAHGSQVLLAYNSTTATTVKHGFVSTAGVAGAMNSRATTSAVSVLGCAVDNTPSNYAVFWGMDGNSTCTAAIYSSSSVQVLAPTVLKAAETGTFQLITGDFVGTKLHVLYTVSSANPPQTKHGSVTTAGVVVAPVRWFKQASLVSHAFHHNSYVYACFMSADVNEDAARQNLFVARCSDVPGWEAEIGVASNSQDRWIVAAGFAPVATTRKETGATLSHVQTVTADSAYRFPAVYLADGTNGRGFKQVDLITSENAPLIQAGQCVYQPGAGGLWQYDGRWITESGFWQYPYITSCTASGAGGSLDAASYGYRFYYEWANGKGERERSASVEATVTPTAGQKVTIVIRPLSVTNKISELGVTPVSIVGYRTLGGETDAYYRCTSSDPSTSGAENGYIENDHTADAITWVDSQSDDTISSKEQDYLSAGELDQVAPAPCSVVAAGNGRLYLSGFEDPQLIRYSKTRGTGEPVAFNEALEIILDAGVGAVTGLAFASDNLVVFREGQTFIVAGDGFDNVGAGSTLGPPRLVSEVLGCTSQKSIVNVPQGVIFQSKKGIYLLTHGGEFQYIGADVESYNSQTVLSAVAMPDSEEVRFLMSGGTILLYDYAAQQWSSWSIGGLDLAIWTNTFVRLVDATASVYQEDTSYVDGSTTYAMVVETPWYAMDQLQSAKRFYNLHVIGEFRSGHKIQVEVFYDYKSSASYTHTWNATSIVTGSAIYQFVVPLTIQKCEAVKFKFTDIVDDVPTALRESYRLTELALEVGFKGGPFREGVNRRATY